MRRIAPKTDGDIVLPSPSAAPSPSPSPSSLYPSATASLSHKGSRGRHGKPSPGAIAERRKGKGKRIGGGDEGTAGGSGGRGGGRGGRGGGRGGRGRDHDVGTAEPASGAAGAGAASELEEIWEVEVKPGEWSPFYPAASAKCTCLDIHFECWLSGFPVGLEKRCSSFSVNTGNLL